MKVRAKHWLNFDGTWHRCGEEFSLPADEAERLRASVEILDAAPPVKKESVPETPSAENQQETHVDSSEFTSEIFPPETPKRRGRKPKSGD